MEIHTLGKRDNIWEKCKIDFLFENVNVELREVSPDEILKIPYGLLRLNL